MLQRAAPEQRERTHRIWLVLLAAGIIVGIAMGLRQVAGLYLTPMTVELNIGREPFSLAMAIANLVWGLAAVPLGAVADRYGAGRVLLLGALSSMGGIYMMYAATSETHLLLSGVLLGIGVGGTGITALVGAVGRAVPPERQPQAIAALGMASGIGSFVAFPYIHLFIEWLGWRGSLLVSIATLAVIIPLALVLAGKPRPTTEKDKGQSLTEACSEAFAHPSFWLLVLGFFVCGFHVAFYGVHLPAFVADQQMPASVAVAALTAVGIANIVGTYLSGQSAKFFPKKYSLSFIYFMRCFAFLGLLYLPINAVTVIGISVLLGLFWLSTVPLTSAMVATFFGAQWMSMLFGFVFLSHQVGSFVGLWLAGTLYDSTNSYDMMWWISIGLGLFAALVHLPIREQPVARLLGEALERLRINITPHVVEFGTMVIRISHITSAAIGRDYPLRPLGVAFVVAAAGLAVLPVSKGVVDIQLPVAPSLLLWVACASAVLGTSMAVLSRRRIVIRTVDGSAARLPSPSFPIAKALIARIRTAMEDVAEGAKAEQLEPADLTLELADAMSNPPATQSGPYMIESSTMTSERRDVADPASEALQDLHALMSTISAAEIQHKAELLDLLRVVERRFDLGEELGGNVAPHWDSFAEYARRYLGHIDGLLDQTDRFDRYMGVS